MGKHLKKYVKGKLFSRRLTVDINITYIKSWIWWLYNAWYTMIYRYTKRGSNKS